MDREALKRTRRSWYSMRSRCKFVPRYQHITVCERWSSFDAFLADMGERPEGTSIDRIDGRGNYEPGNCRWATPAEQAMNRKVASHCRFITYRGESKTTAAWAAEIGIPRHTLYQRVFSLGWTPERALIK